VDLRIDAYLAKLMFVTDIRRTEIVFLLFIFRITLQYLRNIIL